MSKEKLTPDLLVSLISNTPEEQQIIPPKTCPEPNEENWQEVIEFISITPDKDYSESVYGIDRVGNGQNSKLIMTEALTVISAKPKTAKTKQAYLFAAIALQSDILNSQFFAKFPATKEQVVYVDTEQSLFDNSIGYKILQELTGINTHIRKLKMLSLRNLSCSEKMFLLIRYIYANPLIALLIIDGIRDFVSDPNSGEEANTVVSALLKMATENMIAIVVVIHQNKIDNNLRGHLGTEIMNKAHTVMSIDREDELFIVRPVVTRLKPFLPWAFKIDSEGVPRIDEQFNEESSSKPKFSIEEQSVEFHREVLADAFLNGKPDPGWADLKSSLKAALKTKKQDAGDNKLREMISYYLKEGFLIKEPVAGRSYDAYRIVTIQ